ncbi:transcriptional regulator SIN3 PWA37_002129 [Arxiozyma heterogenica]|uniref:transcriptional regulator SIN3 n=1 Tax=Arxiozyma heterogenica TaxID=278026 RepID=UPI002EFDF38E
MNQDITNNNDNNNNINRYNSIPSISHTLSNTSISASTSASNTTATTTTATTATAGRKRKSSNGFSLANFDNPLPADQQYPHSTSTSSSSSTASSSYPQPSIHIQNNEDHNNLQAQAQAQTDSNSYRSLNVKDALSYLEQVKLQFNSKPYIYNQFLDIMKDFKSQNIDTPGVIERVSNLFKGYPILIQGFNTFLPQGYRIDCTNNPDDPIKVTTPLDSASTTNTTTTTTAITNTNTSTFTSTLQPPPIAQYSSNQHVVQSNQLPLPTPVIPTSSTVPSTIPSTVLPTSSTSTVKKPNNVEFSQAINYVNKIKNRFANQPEVYKNFLEILQTYQREQKPIDEVYSQVTLLFRNAPDLLEDFKKFLPDSTVSDQPSQPQVSQQQQQQQQNAGIYPNGNYLYGGASTYYPSGSSQNGTPGPSNFNIPRNQHQQQQQNLPPIGSFSPPSNSTNGSLQDEYKTTESQQQQQQQPGQVVGLPPIVANDQSLDHTSASLHNQYINTTQTTNDNLPISSLRDESGPMDNQVRYATQQQQQLQQQLQMQQQIIMEDQLPVRPEIDLDPSIVPVVPEPTEPIEANLTLMEETTFFEKAKKFIGNKQIYTEFLKVLNLFSQDIININELVDKVENFLGGQPDLFNWFKNFVGYQDKPKIIENIVHEKHKLDLDLCEAYGPSYKKLPKTDTYMPCSGRDDMCWQVLNDEWVGHPVWASEDSGFIAHRKNQYEETLFKIEEERHEYDYYIESNLRTIQTLETIANRIANMTPEEKKNFKLPPGLGHTSLTIYKKVIRKVYDKERGFEIIDALHEHPAITVPVVLKRLKQKDEEWRRAQREWNKVWRELEQKVYFKSLDHLGLTFKQADKKLLTTKQLVSEISSIKVDQNNKRMHWLTPKPKSQLDYQFNDFNIFYDIIRLADIFIDHSSTYSNPDKLRLKDLLRTVISLFFFIPMKTINDAVKERSKVDDQDDGKSYKDVEQSNETNDSKMKRTRDDVEFSLSDIFHKAKYQKLKNSYKENDTESPTEGDAEKLAEEADLLNEQEARRPWLLGNMIYTADSCGAISNRRIFNMFANTNIYIFLRHWTAIYTRLYEIKEMNEKVTKEINSRKLVQFAVDLNLLSTQLRDMGLDFMGKDSYQEVLSMSKRLIENKLEHQWFEESLRQAFNNKAFKMYTVDKVTQSLVKHLHSLMADSKTSEIMLLFEKDRHSLSTSTKDQILYRLQTRSHMSNVENMFRIEYNKDTHHVCIQYIALDDLTLNTKQSSDTDKWKYYITSYSLPHPTEGINQDKLYAPFLERILDFENEALDVDDPANSKYSPEGVSHSILKIKIDKATYAMEIESGSYDIFSRKSINRYPIKINEKTFKKSLKKKIDTIDKFLGSQFGWKRGLGNISNNTSVSTAVIAEKSDSSSVSASSSTEKENIAITSQNSCSIPVGNDSNN